MDSGPDSTAAVAAISEHLAGTYQGSDFHAAAKQALEEDGAIADEIQAVVSQAISEINAKYAVSHQHFKDQVGSSSVLLSTISPCVLEHIRCRATDSLGQDDLSASCRATSCLTYHLSHRQSLHTTPSTRRDRCGAKHRMSARRCARLTLLLRLRSSPPLLRG